MESLFSTLPLLSVPPSTLNESTGVRKWIVRDARDAGQQQIRLINLTNGNIERGFPSSIPYSIDNTHELLLNDKNLTHDVLEMYPHHWNQNITNYLSQKMSKLYATNVTISKKTHIFEHVIDLLDAIYNSILDYQEYPFIWYQIENFRKIIYHLEQILKKWKIIPFSNRLEKFAKQLPTKEEKIEEEDQIINELEEKLYSKIQQYKQSIPISSNQIVKRRELANYLVSYLCREQKRKLQTDKKTNFIECFDKDILFFNFSKLKYQKYELVKYFSHLLESSRNILQFLSQICHFTLYKYCKELKNVIHLNIQIVNWKKQLKEQFVKEKQKLMKTVHEKWLRDKTELERLKITKFEELYSLELNSKWQIDTNLKHQILNLKQKLQTKYQMHSYSTIIKEGLTVRQRKIVLQYLTLCNTCLQYHSLLQHCIFLLKQFHMEWIGRKQFDQLIAILIKDVSQQRQVEDNVTLEMNALFGTILPSTLFQQKKMNQPVEEWEGLQVTPGIRLCQKQQLVESVQKKYKSVTSLQLLQGMYEQDDYLYSSLVGHIHIDTTTLPSTAQISVQTVSNLINKNNYLIVPELNSTVLCRVLRVNNAMAKCNILSVNGKALYYEFPAMIRQQDVRATEIDKVVMGECFRPGDIVQAQILSLGDQRNYYLTTAKNELGVVYAKCLQSQSVMIPLNWNTMQCMRTGIQEPRKVAKWNITEAS